jgi:hypothetical protein
MDRRSLIFSAVLVASITLSCIPITAQPSDVRLNGMSGPKRSAPQTPNDSDHTSNQHQNASDTATAQPQARNEQLAKETEQRDREIKIQEGIAYWTKALVIVGGIVGGLQVLLMVFTSIVTNKTANAAALSARVANETLLITQRAHLSIGHWEIRNYGPDLCPTIFYIVSNKGHAPAKLRTSRTQVWRGEAAALAEKPTFTGGVHDEGGVSIRPGETQGTLVPISTPITAAEHAAIEAGTMNYWFLMQLIYHDGFIEGRHVGACVIYNAKEKAFHLYLKAGYNDAD